MNSDRIFRNPETMEGKPCIRGTRVTFGTIVGLIAAGHSTLATPSIQSAAQPLDRSPGQTEVRSRGNHVPVTRPDITFSQFLGGCQMHGIRRSQKDVTRSGDHQVSRSAQQRFVHGNEVPQSVPRVLQGQCRQRSRIFRACRPFTDTPMQHSVKLG